MDALGPNQQAVPPEQVLPRIRQDRPRFRNLIRQLLQVVVVGALAVGCYFIISRFFLQSVTVVGMSMSPTLQDSEHYLLNRWVYHVRAPERNDLVVLRDPGDKGFSVKRIVAADGDSVRIAGGTVYINGRRAFEPYLKAGMPTYPSNSKAEQVFKCESGQYFVLGDNRGNSVDSRVYGPVSRSDILGLIIR